MRSGLLRFLIGFILGAILLAGTARADGFTIDQYLNVKSAIGGSWAPDGRDIAYLSNASGTNQVWQISAQGGEPKQLTNYPDEVSFVEYSPVEPKMIFGKDEGGNERTQLYVIDGDGGNVKRLTNDDAVINKFGAWSHNGKRFAYAKNKREPRFFDVYVMDVATGKEHLAYQSDEENSAVAWSWNDKDIIVSTTESSFNNNLTLVEIPSLKDALLTPHQGWATYGDIAWPPKKDYFYLLSNLGQEWTKLGKYILTRRTIEIQEIARWDAESLALSRDGKRMAYSLNIQGFSKSVLIDIPKEKLLGEVKLTDGLLKGYEFSPDGTKILFNFSSANQPSDLWVYDIAAQKSTRLTHSDLAGLPPESFVAPELVTYHGYKDLPVPAYLYLPKGVKKDGTNAAVIWAHGGPESQDRPGFSKVFQYLLNQGVAILAPNVRGSTGYGKSYTHLDDKEKRLDSIRDYASGVEYLRTLGWFDPKKIGIGGGSYGGYVVYASLAEYPDLYACGVSIVGISNFVTFLEKTGPWRRANREAEYGSLTTDREFLESISPIRKVDQIRAPLMIIQGANDPRVPKEEAEQMADALRKKGQPVEYLLYPDEGHGLKKLKNVLDAYPKMAEFLKKYLLSGTQK